MFAPTKINGWFVAPKTNAVFVPLLDGAVPPAQFPGVRKFENVPPAVPVHVDVVTWLNRAGATASASAAARSENFIPRLSRNLLAATREIPDAPTDDHRGILSPVIGGESGVIA